ncbi:hypothetical protein SNEBB_009156 [Seison nebaliae]|nr:hypothetical protein SNEBB_009156 [Seison nebaliae]
MSLNENKSHKILKICLIISQAIIIILGITMIIFGFMCIWNRNSLGIHKNPIPKMKNTLTKLANMELEKVGIIILIYGISILFITLLGLCGTCSETFPCLIVFAVMILINIICSLVMITLSLKKLADFKKVHNVNNVRRYIEAIIGAIIGFSSLAFILTVILAHSLHKYYYYKNVRIHQSTVQPQEPHGPDIMPQLS